MITSVLVCKSAERIFNVADTRPPLSVNKASEAALAAAPSLTPSAKNWMTFLTTRLETHFAPLPELCPSASTTDIPPFGRSMTSAVSPLEDVAYFLILEMAIWTSMPKFYFNILELETQRRWMLTSGNPPTRDYVHSQEENLYILLDQRQKDTCQTQEN